MWGSLAAAASLPVLTLPLLFPLFALVSTCRVLAVNQPAALSPLPPYNQPSPVLDSYWRGAELQTGAHVKERKGAREGV